MAVSTVTAGNPINYSDYDSVMQAVLSFRRTVGLDTDSGTAQRDRVLPHNPIHMGSQNYTVLADTINELSTAASATTSQVNSGCPSYYAGHFTTNESSNETTQYIPQYDTHLNTDRQPHNSGARDHHAYNTNYLTSNNGYHDGYNTDNHSYNWAYYSSDHGSADGTFHYGYYELENWYG